MVIVSKYRLERNEKRIFFVISEEDAICPECGSPLCRRDRKLRVHKEAGGKKSWFAIMGSCTRKFEIKVKGKYGAYRIYGYRRANGQWVFDYFCKAHK